MVGQISTELFSVELNPLHCFLYLSLSQFGQRGGVVHKGGKATGREDWASQGGGRRRVCNQETGKKNKPPKTTHNLMRLTHLKDQKSTMIGVQNWGNSVFFFKTPVRDTFTYFYLKIFACFWQTAHFIAHHMRCVGLAFFFFLLW